MKLQNMHRRFAKRAVEPRYSFPEAAELVSRPAGTLRRWALGNWRIYQGEHTLDSPLIAIDGDSGRGGLPLSFLNLLELKFLASYREEATLPAIRRALDYAASQLKVERPLLEADFALHGHELFLAFAKDDGEPYFVNASRGGQVAGVWTDGADYLFESLDYDEEERAAFRWWPLGKDRPVMVDTRLGGGHPTTAHSAVRTAAIAARSRNGWSAEAIAGDVGAENDEIEAALELEHVVAA